MKFLRVAICVVAVLIVCVTFGCAQPKQSVKEPSLSSLLNDTVTYQADSFSIKMQSGLVEYKLDESKADVAYKSDFMIFSEKKVEKPWQNVSLSSYLQLCLDGVTVAKVMVYPVTEQNGYAYSAYSSALDNHKTFHMVYAYQSQNYFFCVNFVCFEEVRHTFEPAFMKWADSVTVWDYNATNSLILK